VSPRRVAWEDDAEFVLNWTVVGRAIRVNSIVNKLAEK
jgi:hypothetical protein